MDLETIIQSEVSQEEKNKYCIVMNICRRRKCNPLQYSCLKPSMDRGALWATVHGLAKRGTGLSMHSQRIYVESRQLVQKNLPTGQE